LYHKCGLIVFRTIRGELWAKLTHIFFQDREGREQLLGAVRGTCVVVGASSLIVVAALFLPLCLWCLLASRGRLALLLLITSAVLCRLAARIVDASAIRSVVRVGVVVVVTPALIILASLLV